MEWDKIKQLILRNRDKLKKVFILAGIILLGCLVGGFVFNCFVSNGFVFKFNLTLLFNIETVKYTALLLAIALICYGFYYYKHYWLKASNRVIKGHKRDSEIDTNLEGSKWQTDKEIAQNFTTITYDELSMQSTVGIPIKALQTGDTYNISLAPPTHTLVIGTTGSGKTTTFINPTIQILSECKGKPSMVITDPKGELFSLHASSLRQKGYNVKVLDLRNPYRSIKWNPLERPYQLYHKMLNLEYEAVMQEDKGCWLFESNEYYDHSELENVFKVRKQELYDELYEDLHDLASVLCPIKNTNEPIWESGAKNFCLAVLLALLEDSSDNNLQGKLDPKDRMDISKYNFYNLKNVATNTENECRELQRYFANRKKTSRCIALSKQVLDTADKTRGSYLSTLFDKLNLFSDISLCSLTSANEIDFATMVDEPTALFLQIPDEKDTRHPLAAMVILQAYKELVRKANTYPDLTLPRHMFFLLDEFGNMPAIHKLEQMITVGRSRKIWLTMVVQSYAQLSKVYDDKVAEIIKSNCNIQCFIGSTSQQTIEDFSKRCGNKSVITRSVGYNSAVAVDINSNASIKERPLIYPIELQQLNRPGEMGNTIVTVFGYQPIKSKFTPSFECKSFILNLIDDTNQTRPNSYFDEEQNYYDIIKRNNVYGYDTPPSGMPPKNAKIKTNSVEKQRSVKIGDLRQRMPKCLEQLLDATEYIQMTTMLQNGRWDELLSTLEKAKERSVNLREHDKVQEVTRYMARVNKTMKELQEKQDVEIVQ
jgi:type IV secretion system protein VirD4